MEVEEELENAERDQAEHGDAMTVVPPPATGAPPPAGLTMGPPPVKKEKKEAKKEARRARSLASMKSEERDRGTSAPSGSEVDTSSYTEVEGKVCTACVTTRHQCRWAADRTKACARCVKQKCKCDARDRKPGEEAKAVKKGKAKAANQDRPEEEAGPESPSRRPAKKRKRDSRGSAAASSSGGALLDRLRERTVQEAGQTNIAPSEYGGPQPVHDQQMFPGLVADMADAFEDGEASLWGNYMNVAANTHLQIDGSVRALLEVQEAAAEEAAESRVQLESIGESLAVLAGAAITLLRGMPGNAPPVTREALLGLGLGEAVVAEPVATPPMDVDDAEPPEASEGDSADRPGGSGAGGTGKTV